MSLFEFENCAADPFACVKPSPNDSIGVNCSDPLSTPAVLNADVIASDYDFAADFFQDAEPSMNLEVKIRFPRMITERVAYRCQSDGITEF